MKKHALTVVLLHALTGCSAALVPASNDPYQLLAYADSLLSEGRPTAAERLITQALDICKQKNDERCLVESYRVYGRFFMSDALNGHWKAHYIEHGFRDTTAVYAQRYNKAIEWLNNTLPYLEQTKRFDFITNVKFNMAVAYQMAGEMEKSCIAYDESVAANKANIKANPQARVIAPQGFASYSDYISAVKIASGCH